MLLLNLFLSLSLSTKNRSVQASYPIDRYLCKANIDGYDYDLTNFANNRKIDSVLTPDGEYKYYFRLCTELTKADIDIDIDLTDVYAVRCKADNNKTCVPLLTSNSWDWQFYNTRNKENGVIYFAHGEPIKVDDINYYTFDLEVEVTCDHDNDDPSDPIDPAWNDQQAYDTLRISFQNIWGCGQTAGTTPTPTPNPFAPDCIFFDRYDPNMDFAVNADLSKLNGPPFGIKSDEILIEGLSSKAELFYQPCERMFCPLGYICPNDTMSSAWLCYENDHKCDSYGIIKHQEKYVTKQEDLLDGINITFPSDQGNSMTLLLSCNRFLTDGHIKFDTKMTLENQRLIMKGESKSACLIPQPDPTPHARCYFQETNVFQDSTITINLTTLDKPDNVGWVKTVKQKVQSSYVNWELRYQPCDNLFCPADHSCEGDEDATIYLCNTTNHHCIGYGMLSNDILIDFESSYDITEGVKVDYYGDIGRTAVVNYVCDSTLGQNDISIDDEIEIYKKELFFTVKSKQACGSNNPQPREPWHPPTPTPPTKPTPTPQPSVNPVDIYVINDTHFMITALNEYVSQDVFKGNLTIAYKQVGIETKMYAEFHPYKFLPCPTGHKCSANHADANFWLCWDENGTPYCHAIGDIRILNEMKPITETNPDKGANLIFGGVWGLGTTFEIFCNPGESSEEIPFDRATVMFYSTGKNGPLLQVFLDSRAVCPLQFVPAETPAPSPRITPRPDYTPQTVFTYSDSSMKKSISVDLGQLEMHDELITVGYYEGHKSEYQRNLFRYYPKTPGVAPTGYTVLDNDNADNSPVVANVWRCFNNTQGKWCHTCGNLNIDLEVKLIDKNITHGIELNYEGGYGGYESFIHLLCNESIPGNSLDFDDVGVFIPELKQPIIYAHTSRVCPYNSDVPTARNSVTGGSVFLTLVIFGLVIYIASGVLFNYIRNGSLDFPHMDFWQSFFQCVKIAVYFIFTCGRTKGPATDSNLYEKA